MNALRRLSTALGRRTVSWLGVAILASLILAALELAVAVVLQLFLATIGVLAKDLRTQLSGLTPSVGLLAVALLVIAVMRAACQFLVSQSGNVAMETITARLRRIAIWEMLLHPKGHLVPASEINARVGDLAVKSSLFCYHGANLVGVAVQALALVPIMLVTATRETLVGLAGLGLVGLVVLWLNAAARRLTAGVPGELRFLTRGIERVARNALLVHALRTEREEHRHLSASVDKYARLLIRAGRLGSVASAAPPLSGVLLILVIIVLSQRYWHTPGLILISFLYLFVRFASCIGNSAYLSANCSNTWPAFADSMQYVGRFRRAELKLALADTLPAPPSMTSAATQTDRGPSILFRHVTFAYPNTSVEVLRDVSLAISEGAQFGIVGPSGCGKSTLVGLILGVLETTRGEVLVGGRSPLTYFSDRQTRIGYVGAEAFLIAGSIRDNLRYGLALHVVDSDLFQALDAARLRDVVEALPGGLDYLIGEDGSGLSAGQKQRLCLARALLNKPHVLVLDEVSANLDLATEADIAASLKDLKGRCTTVIVSHREGILKNADDVLVLKVDAGV